MVRTGAFAAATCGRTGRTAPARRVGRRDGTLRLGGCSRGGRQVALVLVALLLAVSTAAGEPPIRHEGKSLDDWVAQLNGKSERRADDAIDALARARFLVGASEVAVPALVRFMRSVPSSRYLPYTAFRAIGGYGPLAASAGPDLRWLESRSGNRIEALVARIRIGDEPEVATEALKAVPKRARDADKSLWPLAIQQEAAEVATLGPRLAEVSPEFVLHMTRVAPSEVVEIARNMGARGAQWASMAREQARSKNAILRGRAAEVLAWSPGLAAEAEETLLSLAKAFASGPFQRTITLGIARKAHQPVGDVITFLQGRAASGDPVAATWAKVGLARRQEGAPRAALLPAFVTALKHADPEVRVAGAEGILGLVRGGVETVPDLHGALADADLRVRWRAAAVLCREGESAEVVRAELERALDGPDDEERIFVLRTLAWLGMRAEGVLPAVTRWRKVPFHEISREASAAFTALGGS